MAQTDRIVPSGPHEPRVVKSGDRPFGWVAALAILSGAAVMVPSLAVLAISLFAVLRALLQGS